MLRTAIVAALALFIAPLLYHDMLGASLSLVAYAGLAIKELILGTLIGLILGLPFWMYESVGALFDNQRGALMGGQINPQLGPDATPLGYLMKQVIILLLIVGPGLNAATQLIWDSYRIWPPLTAAAAERAGLGSVAGAAEGDLRQYGALRRSAGRAAAAA